MPDNQPSPNSDPNQTESTTPPNAGTADPPAAEAPQGDPKSGAAGGKGSGEGNPSADPKSAASDSATEVFSAEALKLPEGFETNERFAAFTEFAKTNGLKTEQAQALLDLYGQDVVAQRDALQVEWDKVQTAWQDQIKTDPEIGGSKLDGTLQKVARMLDTAKLSDGKPIFEPEFRQALELTGAGNHLAVAKALARLASILVEGGQVNGSSVPRDAQGRFSAQRPSIAEAFYGPEGPKAGPA